MRAMVYLLTNGDGSDGNEWSVLGIFTTRDKASAAKQAYEAAPISRPDGSHYFRNLNDIEEWDTDPSPDDI
jgi:hypothetical protein